MQEQLRRLEAHAVGADVEDAVLHRLEGFRDTGDGTAVAFDEDDLVFGFLGHAAHDLGHEELCRIGHIDRRAAGMPGADAQGEDLGCRRHGKCHEYRDGCRRAQIRVSVVVMSFLPGSGRPAPSVIASVIRRSLPLRLIYRSLIKAICTHRRGRVKKLWRNKPRGGG